MRAFVFGVADGKPLVGGFEGSTERRLAIFCWAQLHIWKRARRAECEAQLSSVTLCLFGLNSKLPFA